MRRLAALLAIAGIALATFLIARTGAATVAAALGSAGLGVVWAALFHAIPMAANARAWQCVTPGRRPLGWFFWLVWVREAVNALLPVARVGGEVATARLMIARGLRGPAAVASLVADMTISLATQLAFTLGGAVLLGRHAGAAPLARAIWPALAVAAAVVAPVALLQRRGLFHGLGCAARVVSSRFGPLAGSGHRLDRALAATYHDSARVAACAGWQLAGWTLSAGEVWLFLRFAGHGVAAVDAVLVEALVQAFASAAFVVPGALGIQEGAFLAVGAAIGLPPQLSLALALARRARDLLVFLPALLLWQAAEGRRLLGQARRSAAPSARAPLRRARRCATQRLIVNADDFGLTPAVNEAVIRAHRDGILTSASLMVTGDAAAEAVALAGTAPGLAVGLHLALADARPVLPPDEIPHLCGPDGRLLSSPARMGVRLALSRAARRELSREIAAQFQRFAATGLPLSHVDGHHHLHLHPAAFQLVVELAERNGARGVRLPRDPLRHLAEATPRVAVLEAIVLALLAAARRGALRRRGLAFAGEVHGLLRSGRMDPAHVCAVLHRVRGSAEIFLHPSTERGDARGASPEDLAALLSPAVREAIAARGLALATYATLEAP